MDIKIRVDTCFENGLCKHYVYFQGQTYIVEDTNVLKDLAAILALAEADINKTLAASVIVSTDPEQDTPF